MNINDIKYLYEASNELHHYFSKDTLRFFNQKLRDFKVRKINDTNYFFYAPSRWEGRLMGYSQGIFNTVDNKIHSIPEELKLKTEVLIDEVLGGLKEFVK